MKNKDEVLAKLKEFDERGLGGIRMDDLMVRHMSLLGFSTSARSNSVLLAPAAGLCFDTLFALACWILAALTYMWRPSFAPSFAAGFL